MVIQPAVEFDLAQHLLNRPGVVSPTPVQPADQAPTEPAYQEGVPTTKHISTVEVGVPDQLD